MPLATNTNESVQSLVAAGGVHHVGIAVPSLVAARTLYEGVLGGDWEGVEEIAQQRVRVAFVRMASAPGTTLIELLEPMGEESPIAKFLAKRGPGLHHIAYQVARLDERLAALERHGVELIDRIPRRGAHGLRIAFLHPRSTGGVLTELCEPAEAVEPVNVRG